MAYDHNRTAYQRMPESGVDNHESLGATNDAETIYGVSSYDSSEEAQPRRQHNVNFDQEQLGLPPSHTFLSRKRRFDTNLEDARVEVRHTHDYFLRRPRPPRVEYRGRIIEVGQNDKLDDAQLKSNLNAAQPAPHHLHEHHPDSLRQQRERMDLFVDLVWVGIISNISEHFFSRVFAQEVYFGGALGEFILLFIPAFRIWVVLQKWLNAYYVDDYFQRIFIIWILILGLVWGNNAPFLIDNFDNNNDFLIMAYIIAMASFSVAELIYSKWMPWLRRSMLLGMAIGLPAAAIWIALTLNRDSFQKEMLLTGAIIYHSLEQVFFASPLADRLLGDEIHQASDNRMTIKRYEGFFIIAIGEGVFLLIRQSPLGRGFNIDLGRGVLALLLYYALNWSYFQGSASKRYIHPMERRWWIKLLWQWLHLPLFGGLVILSSAILYLVQFQLAGTEIGGSEPSSEPSSEPPSSEHRRRSEEPAAEGQETIKFDEKNLEHAIIITFITVAVIQLSNVLASFLALSLDERGSLRVSRPWLRMMPRILSIPLLATIWLVKFTDPSVVLGIVTSVVASVLFAEQLMGMPKHARFLEPKSAALSAYTSHESDH